MVVQTRVFGEIEVDDEKVFTFPAGIPGFPGFTLFVVLDMPGGDGSLKWMQALGEPGLGFVLLDPTVFFPRYAPAFPSDDLETVGLQAAEDGVVMLVATVPEHFEETTANLRAPILFNPLRRLGKQVIMDESDYPVRRPVFAAARAKRLRVAVGR